MQLDSLCKHCQSRIFRPEVSRKHFFAVPKPIKARWLKAYGYWPLGQYYKKRCEVCGKMMAIFPKPKRVPTRAPKNSKDFTGQAIVLYLCSFSDRPVLTNCADFMSCDQKGREPKCQVLRKQKAEGLRKS